MKDSRILEASRYKYLSVTTFLVCIYTILGTLLFSMTTIPTLNQMFNNKISFLLNVQLITVIAFIVYIFIICLNYLIPRNVVISACVILGIAVVTLLGLKVNVPIAYRYITSLVILGMCFSSMVAFDQRKIIILVLSIGAIESLLGIIQHFFKLTIFNPIIEGKPIYNAIFFSNGHSSNDISQLFGNVSIRSFGTMDSGLVLGIFCIFCLSLIPLAGISRSKEVIFSGIFLMAIYGTITRNIYFATGLFIIIIYSKNFFLRNKRLLKYIYIILMCMMAVAPFLQSLILFLTRIAQNFSIVTFGVRYNFLNIGIDKVPGIYALLFGSNIYPTATVPLDNSFIADMLGKGLVFALLENYLLYLVFNQCLQKAKSDNFSIIAFMILYPFIGFSNSVSANFIVLFAICSLIMMNEHQNKVDL